MKDLEHFDWEKIKDSVSQRGFAVLPALLTSEACDELIRLYPTDDSFRSVISMQRYRFGQGEYKYFRYPLPPQLQLLRQQFYSRLAPLANDWQLKLSQSLLYPTDLDTFLNRCHNIGQLRPTPLLLRYEAGGYNTLHQDLYGDVYFPFQVMIQLTQHGVEHDGGEFVLTEQVPRAQSRATVVRPEKGDAVIFTTHHRPAKSARGFYRAAVRHGVSEITRGVRYAAGIIFHDGR